ncbi:MAG: Wzz/FepE/Etk N-terminal domain-containing protein, partial [candidate division Zixibacteria bacterium]|nr:Wzz/FepE/Etk N-terminal domain-containing protein [candidate division Zixibacteria bacterium]
MEQDSAIKDEPEKEKISLYSYLSVIVGYRRFILLNFLGVCVAVAILSLFLPSWYSANTTILPPQREKLGLGLVSSLAGGISEFGTSMSLPLMVSPSDVIAAILKSRSVALAVIEKEDLMKTYHTKTKEDALRELFSHT